jgi:ABC-type multidrug transport system ATPase subunit
MNLVVQDLTYRYAPGEEPALDQVSISLSGANLILLAGQNGAGKSTLIKFLTGLLIPRQGRILLDGEELRGEHGSVLYKHRIGFCPDINVFDPNLTGQETLWMLKGLRKMGDSDFRRQLSDLIDVFDMRSWIGNALPPSYSLGMRKKLGLCISLLGYPRLAILDEPFSGLDPQGISNFKRYLDGLAKRGTAVLLSTHFLELMEAHFDGLILLDRGQVRFQGSREEFESRIGGSSLAEGFRKFILKG